MEISLKIRCIYRKTPAFCALDSSSSSLQDGSSSMPSILERLEAFLGRKVLFSFRGRDAKLFVNSAPFTNHSKPTIQVASPECGPSQSSLLLSHTPLATNRFPELQWSVSSILQAQIAEYVVIVEDPDAPLPSPVVHGIYYAIPSNKTSLLPADFELSSTPNNAFESVSKTINRGRGNDEEIPASNSLRGGFRYGLNRMKNVWGGPKPVLGHGPHRYFFQVVGLTETVDWDTAGTNKSGLLNKAQITRIIDGQVAGWGVWIGTFERSPM